MPDADVLIGQCIGALLAIPSVFLYTIECAVIIYHWRKHFNFSFYKLFLISAFTNLVLNFLCNMDYRLNWIPFVGNILLASPDWLCRFFFAVHFYQLHVDNLLILFTLLQRLTIILRPFDNEKIWRFLFPVATLLSFGLPLGAISHLFTLEVRFFLDDTVGVVYLDYDHSLKGSYVDIDKPSNSQILFISSVIFLVLQCLLNMAILFAYKRSVRSQQGQQHSHQSRTEFRLMVYAGCIFVGQLVISAHWIILYLLTWSSFRVRFINQYVWLNDLRSVVFPSWFLLWASSEVRAKVSQMLDPFLFWRPKSTTTTAVVSLQQQQQQTNNRTAVAVGQGSARLVQSVNITRH